MHNICVIGLGTIGLPTALYLQSMGTEVCGCDLNPGAIKRANEYGIQAMQPNGLPSCDVYVICVNTFWDSVNSKVDLSPVEDTFRTISETSMTSREPLISVESTMPVGSTRRLARKYELNHVVHVPHRFWPAEPEKYGVRQLRVIGALNDRSLELGQKFFKLLDIPLHVCSSLEIAELTKVTENTQRYVEIAFAEELAMICSSFNLDYDELRKSVNTHFHTDWADKIKEARDGIGGTCLPKDIRFLSETSQAPTPLLRGAMYADSLYQHRRKKVADQLLVEENSEIET